jgi:hypothetical protein
MKIEEEYWLRPLLVETHPPGLAIGEIILDAHGDDGANAGEGVSHNADERSVAQPHEGKDCNRRVRTAMVELAWLWLRWQPESTLSIWFRERVGKAGGRIKKIMIVALAPVRARRTHKE